jgi:hypothetical protein
MNHQKKQLLTISKKVDTNEPLTPEEITQLLTFEKLDKESKSLKVLKRAALPASLALGFFFSAFPEAFEHFTTTLPTWTNLSPPELNGIDYLWSLLGDPVGKPNIIYHIPNIVLYSFGILGIKKLIEALDQHTWLNKILTSQQTLKEKSTAGMLNLKMKQGHSLLYSEQPKKA